MGFNDRILKIIELEGITRQVFANSINKSLDYTYKMNNPTLEVLENILKAYPKYSREWLVFGDGEPIKKAEYKIPDEKVSFLEEAKEYTTIEDLKSDINSLKIVIKSLTMYINEVDRENESLRQQKFNYWRRLTPKEQANIHDNDVMSMIFKQRYTPNETTRHHHPGRTPAAYNEWA